MSRRTATPPAPASVRCPLGTLHEAGRQVEIHARCDRDGAMLWAEHMDHYRTDHVLHATAGAAAEALAARYPGQAEGQPWLDRDPIGAAYVQALDDIGLHHPMTHLVRYTGGHLMLDTPCCQILTIAGDLLTAEALARWLARALPDRPVRARAEDRSAASVILGVIYHE